MKLVLDAQMLALIPVGIALWFMIWVLWNWRKEERRKRFRSHVGLPEIIIEPTREREMSRTGPALQRGRRPISAGAQLHLQRPANLLTR